MIAQNLDFSLSKRRVRLISAVLALPLFGIVAAFGIAPSTSTENIQVQIVEQAIPLPYSMVEVDETRRTVLTTNRYKHPQLRENVEEFIGKILDEKLPDAYDGNIFKQK